MNKLKKEIIKEDLDQDNKLTQKEWDKFIEIYNDTFFKETITLADKLFWEYQNNDLKYSRKTKENNA